MSDKPLTWHFVKWTFQFQQSWSSKHVSVRAASARELLTADAGPGLRPRWAWGPTGLTPVPVRVSRWCEAGSYCPGYRAGRFSQDVGPRVLIARAPALRQDDGRPAAQRSAGG